VLIANTLDESNIEQDQKLYTIIGYEGAVSPPFSHLLIQLCSNFPIWRDDIAQACINFGLRLEQDASTLILNSIGLGLQQRVYKHLNDEASEQKVAARKELHTKLLKDLFFDGEVVTFDDNFNDYAIQVIQHYDESESLKLLKIEAERLLSDPNYNPCPLD